MSVGPDAGRPFQRAHALELRRERRHEREHPGIAVVALPDELRDAVDARRAPTRAATRAPRAPGRRECGRRTRSGRNRSRRTTGRTRPRRRARTDRRRTRRAPRPSRRRSRRRGTSRGPGRCAPRSPTPGTTGSVGSVDRRRAASRAGVDLAQLQVARRRRAGRRDRDAARSRARPSAQTLTSHGRPRDNRIPATNAAAEPRIAGSDGAVGRDLEPVEGLFLAHAREVACAPGRRPRCPRARLRRWRVTALSIGTAADSRRKRPNATRRTRVPPRARRALQRAIDKRPRRSQVRRRAADLVARSPRAEQGRLALACQDGRTAEASSCSTSRCKRSRPHSTVSPRANASTRNEPRELRDAGLHRADGQLRGQPQRRDRERRPDVRRRSRPASRPTRRTSTATTSPSTTRRSR